MYGVHIIQRTHSIVRKHILCQESAHNMHMHACPQTGMLTYMHACLHKGIHTHIHMQKTHTKHALTYTHIPRRRLPCSTRLPELYAHSEASSPDTSTPCPG